MVSTLPTQKMKKLFFLLIFYTFPCFASIEVPHYSEDSITTLPILYQGRCRPLEAYARSLLHTFYQRDEFLLSHRQFFEKNVLLLLIGLLTFKLMVILNGMIFHYSMLKATIFHTILFPRI